MFVFTGKLGWEHYGINELLVVILPGPASLGSPAYLYSQWTNSNNGVKKDKFFQHQTITSVTTAPDGGDTFQLGPGYVMYNFHSKNDYRTLELLMHSKVGYKSTMVLERAYPAGEVSADGSGRFWYGSLDWDDLAENEPFVVVVPEGFGEGKPALGIWQWSKLASGQTNVNAVVLGAQEDVVSADGSFQFSLKGEGYKLSCAWDEMSQKLAVNMSEVNTQGEEKGRGLAPLALGAVVESRAEGNDNLNPPETPGEKVELMMHYPQVQPALARIHTPMPFPGDLVDTLTHTASFVDQAGYLAKYAIHEYQTLNAAYQALKKQSEDWHAQTRDLTARVAALTAETKAEKQQLTAVTQKLTEALASAAEKETELTQQIQVLQKKLAEAKAHDADDHKALDAEHKALDEAHEQISKGLEERKKLEGQVITLHLALGENGKLVKKLQATVLELQGQVGELNGKLTVEVAHNKELAGQVGDLKTRAGKAEGDAKAAKEALAKANEDLDSARQDCASKDSIIAGLEDGLVAMKKDRDAKKRAYEELQTSTAATIHDLEEQIAKLKAGNSGGAGGGGSGSGGDGWGYHFSDGYPDDMKKAIDDSVDAVKDMMGQHGIGFM